MLSRTKYLKYFRFVEQLYLKCQELQDENERHVYRIFRAKKVTKKRRKDVSLLKNRLDRYNDNWRQIPIKIRSTKELKKIIKQKNFEPKTRKKQRIEQRGSGGL